MLKQFELGIGSSCGILLQAGDAFLDFLGQPGSVDLVRDADIGVHPVGGDRLVVGHVFGVQPAGDGLPGAEALRTFKRQGGPGEQELQHPQDSEAELRRRLAALLLGEELANKV